MNYYLISTPTGIKAVKTQGLIKDKAEARSIANGPVNFFIKINKLTYYFNKIFRRRG